MNPRPFKTLYRRTVAGWKWLILSRYDDSEIRSGTTLTILAARAAVKQAHDDLFKNFSRSYRLRIPSHHELDVRAGIRRRILLQPAKRGVSVLEGEIRERGATKDWGKRHAEHN